jgi:acetyl-CoA/propionyl-CoA carboxylase biotin carboxyl carrier protein
MQRTAIELDGRRVSLGLPASMWRGLAAGAVADQPVPINDRADAADLSEVAAPITGTLVAWKVNNGAEVADGELIAVMETMKMETQVLAHCGGRITLVTTAGSMVRSGEVIARIG